MISIIIYQNHNKQCVGFSTKGHANYSEEGTDIICSAVSVLTINTINSIEEFTDAKFQLDMNQENGQINFKLKDLLDEKTDLLLKSMILGLHGIRKDYGKKYISIDYKEV